MQKTLILDSKTLIESLKQVSKEKLSYYCKRILSGEYKQEIFPVYLCFYGNVKLIMVIEMPKQNLREVSLVDFIKSLQS